MVIECANPQLINFAYTEIDNPVLLHYAKNKLPLTGVLKQNDIGAYYYLKIHDDFIFKLLPLIKEPRLDIPDYFSPRYNTGAHISVIYSEEMPTQKIHIHEFEQSFSFEIKDFLCISVFNKTLFALSVSSPSLEQLRLKYGLTTKLHYRGLLLPFHITIATRLNIATC